MSSNEQQVFIISTDKYRKAKKGEITCEFCKRSFVRWWSGRLECHQLAGRAYAVGKKHTCDRAELREEQNNTNS